MGLIDRLGYDIGDQSRLQRIVTRLARTETSALLLSRLHEPVDRLWRRVSGRSYATNVLTGLPTIELITTGARSGEERSVMLIAVPFGEDLAVLGTNYGQRRTPGWVHNLEAHPRAVVIHDSRRAQAFARRATGDETERIFEAAAAVFPGYAAYRRRASHREIRVFVLEDVFRFDRRGNE